jgi:hypothetical protein
VVLVATIVAIAVSVVLVKVVRTNNVKVKVNRISNVKVIGKRGEEIATIAIVVAADEMVATKARKVMIVTKVQKEFLNQ